ncbi:MAG: hypothetical protein LKF36_00375 [Lactobacillus sp.]|nr:hypothetical protein [Lactobacillus sp.]
MSGTIGSLKSIFLSSGKERSELASASILKINKTCVVATAAHCVYDPFTTSIPIKVQFMPWTLSKHFDIPVELSRVFVLQKWITTKDLKYDFAFMIPSIECCDRLDKYDGYLPDFNQPLEQSVSVTGFENGLFYRNKYRNSQGVQKTNFFKNTGLVGISSKFKTGMSGGSWIVEPKLQIGVTSATIKGFRNVLWSALWGRDAQQLFNAARFNDLKNENVFTYSLGD